jgi:hypothetical protein
MASSLVISIAVGALVALILAFIGCIIRVFNVYRKGCGTAAPVLEQDYPELFAALCATRPYFNRVLTFPTEWYVTLVEDFEKYAVSRCTDRVIWESLMDRLQTTKPSWAKFGKKRKGKKKKTTGGGVKGQVLLAAVKKLMVAAIGTVNPLELIVGKWETSRDELVALLIGSFAG